MGFVSLRQAVQAGGTHNTKSAIQRMMERFDSERGRHHYSKRMAAVEPSSAIRAPPSVWIGSPSEAIARWMLSGSSTEKVHNIGKLARYGPSFSTAIA